jgi:leader peptidase (prepilin peptidase) / N-methyltransferase
MPILAVFTILLACLLSAISYVDFRQMRAPDWLNALLLLSGLAFWLVTTPGSLPSQILAGTGMAAALWFIRIAHARRTGRIGLGLGDVKMAGAGAVWINPMLLPFFVFSASASGLAYALCTGKTGQDQRLPFAPFLAVGLFSCWITEHYS